MDKITRWKLSEVDLAYMAGIIDGEGYVGISRNRTKRQRHKNPRYQSEICVINTNMDLMNWLIKRVGGRIDARKRKDERWKISYRWRIQESIHTTFLKAIMPYLVIKRRQAELITEYWKNKTRHYKVGRNFEMPPEEVAMREYYYEELRKLNAKGNPEYQQRLSEATPHAGDAIV